MPKAHIDWTPHWRKLIAMLANGPADYLAFLRETGLVKLKAPNFDNHVALMRREARMYATAKNEGNVAEIARVEDMFFVVNDQAAQEELLVIARMVQPMFGRTTPGDWKPLYPLLIELMATQHVSYETFVAMIAGEQAITHHSFNKHMRDLRSDAHNYLIAAEAEREEEMRRIERKYNVLGNAAACKAFVEIGAKKRAKHEKLAGIHFPVTEAEEIKAAPATELIRAEMELLGERLVMMENLAKVIGESRKRIKQLME